MNEDYYYQGYGGGRIYGVGGAATFGQHASADARPISDGAVPSPHKDTEATEPSPKGSGAGDTRAKLLSDASEIVTSDRANAYGPPEDNFKRIAALWEVYLEQHPSDAPINATDVANMMVLMKVARLMQTPGHRDSWLDIAGYAACGYSVASK